MRAIAREMLGRPDIDEAVLMKTARRLEGLLGEVSGYSVPMTAAPFGWPRASASPSSVATVTPMPVAEALDAIRARDGEVRAFVSLLPEAVACEGPLHGMPVAVKDLIDVFGLRTTGGSRLLAENVATADAEVVRRLRAAGAAIIGKTATHEFAYGVTTDSPFHGPTRNPVDPARSPGGSSGGSAAAVAAGMAQAALGTDTAGSIRIPAACCGVIGFKPTYALVSGEGVLPLSWSLDHVGVIARSVGEAGAVLSAIAGVAPGPVPQGARIGVPVNWLSGRIDPDVRARFDESLAAARSLGFAVVEVELPAMEPYHFVSRLLTLAEASAYHAPYLKDRAADYAPDVRARLELGQFVLARDYLLAQRLRGMLIARMQAAMAGLDALATPTMAIPAPAIGQRTWSYPDGSREAVSEPMTRFVAPFNVTGQPAVSVPCGTTAGGLPVGLQLVGHAGGDGALLALAEALLQIF